MEEENQWRNYACMGSHGQVVASILASLLHASFHVCLCFMNTTTNWNTCICSLHTVGRTKSTV
jgi:hypothetical protein